MNMPVLTVAFVLAAVSIAPGAGAAEPLRRVEGVATLEDIPAVPQEVAAAVQRYQSSRSASLADWLSDGSILIATRFGSTAQLHRIAAPMGARAQLTFFGEPVGAAVRVPGSDQFFFMKDTGGDEWFQLYRMSPGGQPVQFTEPGSRNSAPVVTADGKQLYWSRSTRGSASYSILTASVADPATRRVVFQDPGAVTVEDVSDDGRRLLLARRISNVESRLIVLDLASGGTTELAPGAPAQFNGAQFARGGKSVIAVSDRGSDVLRVVEIDPGSGRLTDISPSSKWDADSFDLSKDGRLVAFITNEDGYSQVSVQDLQTGRLVARPPLPKGVVPALRFSPDSQQLAMSFASSASPGDIYTWRVGDNALQRWTASELGPIDAKSLAKPELVRFPSFDGLSVPAFVYRPTRVAAGAKTPVLVMIHGGPEGQDRPGWAPGVQYFADQLGATVITPNVRGSTGYGRRYQDLDNGPKREDSVKDIGALLDWIAKRPDLDAKRVVVMGGSYGGYMVLGSMTLFSDRLAAGMESFGISNWVSFLQNTEAYRRDNRRAEYGDERDPAMRAAFERISPLNNVAKITKPMLVQQGVNDPRVPKSESDQVVAALRARNVPVGYLVFADEGHGWRKKPNQDLARGVETVFLQRIFGAP